ncbi:MAG: TadE/TadG family type IV pilus assembly protein [Hyphomicrobiaceae bacterium]
MPFHNLSEALACRAASLIRADERGTIAIMFALLLVPLVTVTVGALDWGRAETARRQLTAALESGLSFAAAENHDDDIAMEAAFRRAFMASLPDELKEAPVTLRRDREGHRLLADTEARVPAHLLGLGQGAKIDIAAEAERRLEIHTPPSPAIAEALPPGAARDLGEIEHRLRQAIMGRGGQAGFAGDIDPRALELIRDAIRAAH